MPEIFGKRPGKGPFTDMASPLVEQVESKDPRSKVAKNIAFPVDKPRDPLGIVPSEEE